MSDPRARVFISSVIKGYAASRDAAAEGIGRAGCQAVRVEEFPAASASPRTACLDGVRSADAVILVLGERYGYVAPSGLAATEEEYDEARRTHKRVLVFLEDVPAREPRQEAFVRKVQDYVGGHCRKTFKTAAELTRLVEQALSEANMATMAGEGDAATPRIDAALRRRPEPVQGIVWLDAVWATLREEEVIDPLLFGEQDFQRQVQRLAHEAEPPLFAYEQAKRTTPGASSLRIDQGDAAAWRDGRDLVALDLHADGTVSIAQNVTGTRPAERAGDSLYDMYFIDPDVVRERLARAWAFAASWWEHHEPYRRHDPLVYGLALHDVGARRLGKPARSASGGITIPAECPHNPLIVLDRPRKIARGEMGNPSGEIERACKMLERRFREWEGQW